MIQDQNCLISDDSYREILTGSFFHPLSFVFLYMYSDAILYGMLYLYTGPSIFDLIIFFFIFISCIHDLVLFFFVFFYTVVCQYVCHISFSGEGLEFKKKRTQLFDFFLYLNVHTFWTLKKRGNSLIIFSVYFCTNLYRKWGSQQSVCVA